MMKFVGKDLKKKKKERPVPRTYTSINSMTDESRLFNSHTETDLST